MAVKQRVLAVSISSILSLLALEVIVRVLSDYSYPIRRLTFYQQDNITFDHINSLESLLKRAPVPFEPNTNFRGFILNSKGFRTPEYQQAKSPNSFRIVTIGDSFLSDSGPVPYPDHFTVLLETKLKGWLKHQDVEMINLGVPGVGPKFEQKILEIEGLHLNPDLLIWAFFVGNDFTDEMLLGDHSRAGLKRHLMKMCYLCRSIRNATILSSHVRSRRIPKADKMIEGRSGTYIGSPGDYDPDAPTLARDKFIEEQTHRMSVYAKETLSWRQWASIQKTLQKVGNTCREFKIPLLVVIIPDENQVNTSLLKEVVKRLGKTVDELTMDYPQVLLADFLKRNGIEYLDLLPAFKEIGETRRLYALQDTHWNVEGNALAAEMIFKHIVGNRGISRQEGPGGGVVTYVVRHFFLDNLPSARVIRGKADYQKVRVEQFKINNDWREVLFQHPNSEAIFRGVQIDENMKLSFGIGINEQAWGKGGDGVRFEISMVDERSGRRVLFSQYIDPKNNIEDRKWLNETIDLSSFAGQAVTISFKTTGGPNDDITYDWAGWSQPQLVIERRL